MNAVWRVARAAVRKRRLQTIVIGVVVLVSTGTIVLALGLLTNASAPFERALAQQDGAHVVAAFDRELVTDAQLTEAAKTPEVQAVAGPFGQVTLDTSKSGVLMPPTTTLVGRADPGGPVDRLDVWDGRWPSAPGEVVLNMVHDQPFIALGSKIDVPGQPTLTVVGFAQSVSMSADGWVTPGQLAAMNPTATQMLFRFTHAETKPELDAAMAAVSAHLPANSALGAKSYLTLMNELNSETGVYVPFLIVFGILGLAVSVLIVANVVSGAVVAGFRNIGMLKALGFTPNQVMAVYLVMVCVPSIVGCVFGTVLGNVIARPLLADAFGIFGTGDVGVDPWVNVAALLGTPVVVALAALVSALRARGLPAARAISAGSAPRRGRALGVQRWLSGLRLPRSVSLGLGMPFARPARSALTLAAIVLGVTTVTLAIGVTLSVNAYTNATRPSHPDRVEVFALSQQALPPGDPEAARHASHPRLSDREDAALLRRQPGVVRLAATAEISVHVVGGEQGAQVEFYRGDGGLGPTVLDGRWPRGVGEIAVPSRFLNQRGLAVGDTVTLELAGRRLAVRIVGTTLTNSESTVFADWSSLVRLGSDARADRYVLQFSGVPDRGVLESSLLAVDPGLVVLPAGDNTSEQAVVLISTATLLTVVLGVVSALGVFNTVALNARERRRDLGMLKSIGMTPRQVTVMLVTSMGWLGVVGGVLGVPLGVLAHHVIAPAMMRAAQSDVLDFVVSVYRWPLVVLFVCAGVFIAVLGAFLPARSAGRVTIAAVLHNE